MTPQSNFMVLAPIIPERESELRKILDSMNDGPGRVNPNNSLIPFAQFENLHFARLLILNDNSLEDRAICGLPSDFPLQFAFLGDIDGDEDVFLNELVHRAPEGLRRLFTCCHDFDPRCDLLAWMKRHRSPAIANFVNCRGRTVRRIREEANLQETLDRYIAENAATLDRMSSSQLHAKLSEFVAAEKSAGRLTLSGESPTPIAWWIGNALHIICLPFLVLLLVLLAWPLLLLGLLFYVVRMRYLEKTDAEICPKVDRAHSEMLAEAEDHFVTNQYTAFGSRKPGLARLLTIVGALSIVNYAARHITRPGHLGRIRTIHFARWVFLDGKERMVFFSNYDGSVESYMDDFINKTGFGLNAAFGSAIGYPRTRWFLFDGCSDEQKFKNFNRRHTIPTQVWYKATAYLGLTAVDLDRNSRIRKGVEKPSMSDAEASEWVALL
jgi:hypothetical protein